MGEGGDGGGPQVLMLRGRWKKTRPSRELRLQSSDGKNEESCEYWGGMGCGKCGGYWSGVKGGGKARGKKMCRLWFERVMQKFQMGRVGCGKSVEKKGISQIIWACRGLRVL